MLHETHCNTLQHSTSTTHTGLNTSSHTSLPLQHTAIHCNTPATRLQHACSTPIAHLQHTTTHRSYLCGPAAVLLVSENPYHLLPVCRWWCSELQCVSVCCRVLQCVAAACCSALKRFAGGYFFLHCVAGSELATIFTTHCNTLQHICGVLIL